MEGEPIDTGDFDETYQEINLSAGYGIATLDVAIGEYDSPPDTAICTPSLPPICSPDKSDYTFVSLTLEKDGFYGKGIYFANNIAYSHNYADRTHLMDRNVC